MLDYQEDLAAALGYADKDGQRGVERFMREVYTHLQTVAVVTDLFFEHVLEILGMTGAAAGERRLERAIGVRGGTVRLTAPEELGQRLLPAHAALPPGRPHRAAPAPRTRQAVTAHLHLVDDGFRESRRVARIFSELLTASSEIFPVLEAMLATGLLTRYLPEFAAVESLAQHDLYHLYTVDRHQLQTVAELAALRQEMAELFAEAGETEVHPRRPCSTTSARAGRPTIRSSARNWRRPSAGGCSCRRRTATCSPSSSATTCTCRRTGCAGTARTASSSARPRRWWGMSAG